MNETNEVAERTYLAGLEGIAENPMRGDMVMETASSGDVTANRRTVIFHVRDGKIEGLWQIGETISEMEHSKPFYFETSIEGWKDFCSKIQKGFSFLRGFEPIFFYLRSTQDFLDAQDRYRESLDSTEDDDFYSDVDALTKILHSGLLTSLKEEQ